VTLSDPTSPDIAALHADAMVVDTHIHAPHFLPRHAWSLYRKIGGPTMPPDSGLDTLAAGGVDGAVVKAVGDAIATWFHPVRRWPAVLHQLDGIRSQAALADAQIVLDSKDLAYARQRDRSGVFLGVEGADMLDGRLDRLDLLHGLGVRVLGLVHYVDNEIGTVCLQWNTWLRVSIPRPRRVAGLKPFGRQVIDRCADLGIVVDLAHADAPTLLAACEHARRPMLATHTGARALQDFARYLGDEEIRAIAATGGLIGLWPFFIRGAGMADRAAFADHARYLADLVGPDHLCIGTDANGVPGFMEGYEGPRHFGQLTETLVDSGFSEQETRRVIGGNFLRVLDVVVDGARPAGQV